jgi:magnesium transporter
MVQIKPAENGSQKTFCFLSEILGKKIYGKDQRILGKVHDMVATMSDRYPEILGFVFKKGQDLQFLPALSRDIVRLAEGQSLQKEKADVKPFLRANNQFLVRDMLYDKQILDVNGAKVERVNDVQILVYAEKPFLVHVDVGFSGLSRRLGFEGKVRSLAKMFGRQVKDELIGWKFVQPLPERALGPVQVSLRQEQLKQLHPGELADIIEELDRDERLALVRSIDPEDAAEALEEADITVQTAILRELESELAADIIEEMEPAMAVDVMEELPRETQESIMAAMEDEERAQIELLAQAEDETAASLMTVDFISAPQTFTAEQALQIVKARADEVESITYIYCLNEQDRLAGVVSLRDLILARPEEVLSVIMHPRLASLSRNDKWDTVADEFWKYRFKALPVVDKDGNVEGIVTFRHSLDELLPYYYRMAS